MDTRNWQLHGNSLWNGFWVRRRSSVKVENMCSYGWWLHLYCCSDLGEKWFFDMAFSANVTLWSASDSPNHIDPSLENDMDCKLPWVDFVETKKSNIDIVILICLLLTLFFDTFLFAIILLHDDLRKKTTISGCILAVVIFLHFRELTSSWSPSASATCPLLSS